MILSMKVYSIVTSSAMIGNEYFINLDNATVAVRSIGGKHGNDYSCLTKDLSWSKLKVSCSEWMDAISELAQADDSASKGVWR